MDRESSAAMVARGILDAVIAKARREGAAEMRAAAANEAHRSPTGDEARDAILRLPLPGDDAPEVTP